VKLVMVGGKTQIDRLERSSGSVAVRSPELAAG